MSQIRGRIKTVVDYSDYLNSQGRCCELDGTQTSKSFNACLQSGGYFIPDSAGDVSCPDFGERGCCCACAYTTKNTDEDDWLNPTNGVGNAGIRGNPDGTRNNISKCECLQKGGNWQPGECPTEPLDVLTFCTATDGAFGRDDVRYPYACCHCAINSSTGEYERVCDNVCTLSECDDLSRSTPQNCQSVFYNQGVCDYDPQDNDLLKIDCPSDDDDAGGGGPGGGNPPGPGGGGEPPPPEGRSCGICRFRFGVRNQDTGEDTGFRWQYDVCADFPDDSTQQNMIAYCTESFGSNSGFLPTLPGFDNLELIDVGVDGFGVDDVIPPPSVPEIFYLGYICGNVWNSGGDWEPFWEDICIPGNGSREFSGCDDFMCAVQLQSPDRDVSACCTIGGCIQETRKACEQLNGFFNPPDNGPVSCSEKPCQRGAGTSTGTLNKIFIDEGDLPEVGSVFAGGVYMGIFSPGVSRIRANIETGATKLSRSSDPGGLGTISRWAIIMSFTDLGDEFQEQGILYNHTAVSEKPSQQKTSTFDGIFNTYGDGGRYKKPNNSLFNQIRNYNRFSFTDWYLPSIQELGFVIHQQEGLTFKNVAGNSFSNNFKKLNSFRTDPRISKIVKGEDYQSYLSSTRKIVDYTVTDQKRYPAANLVYNIVSVPNVSKTSNIQEKNGFTSLTGLDGLFKIRLFRRIYIK